MPCLHVHAKNCVLFQEDYLKWKGSLLFRFISSTVDEDDDIAQFGRCVILLGLCQFGRYVMLLECGRYVTLLGLWCGRYVVLLRLCPFSRYVIILEL